MSRFPSTGSEFLRGVGASRLQTKTEQCGLREPPAVMLWRLLSHRAAAGQWPVARVDREQANLAFANNSWGLCNGGTSSGSPALTQEGGRARGPPGSSGRSGTGGARSGLGEAAARVRRVLGREGNPMGAGHRQGGRRDGQQGCKSGPVRGEHWSRGSPAEQQPGREGAWLRAGRRHPGDDVEDSGSQSSHC